MVIHCIKSCVYIGFIYIHGYTIDDDLKKNIPTQNTTQTLR